MEIFYVWLSSYLIKSQCFRFEYILLETQQGTQQYFLYYTRGSRNEEADREGNDE